MSVVTQQTEGSIMTATGRWVTPLDPTYDMIDIEDIAKALSNQCRFSGHVKKFYSVAEHSLRVSWFVEDRDGTPMEQLWGLLHDASEAYLVDLARPIKHHPSFSKGYREAEARLMYTITTYFGLPPIQPEIVFEGDNVLLSTEQRDLMPGDEVWYPDVERLEEKIDPMDPEEAEWQFIQRYNVLTRSK